MSLPWEIKKISAYDEEAIAELLGLGWEPWAIVTSSPEGLAMWFKRQKKFKSGDLKAVGAK